jgi:hypothetical protein
MNTILSPLQLPFNYKLYQCPAGIKGQTALLYSLFFYKDCRVYVARKDNELNGKSKFVNFKNKRKKKKSIIIVPRFEKEVTIAVMIVG